MLAEVGVVLRYILISSDGNVAEVAVGLVAGDIADVVCSLDQREACGVVRLGLRGAGHFHGRFQLGQIFNTGLCGRNDLGLALNIENNRDSAFCCCPHFTFVVPCQSNALGGFVVKGMHPVGLTVCIYIRLCRDGDGAGVLARAKFGFRERTRIGNRNVHTIRMSIIADAVDHYECIAKLAQIPAGRRVGLIGHGGSCFFPYGVQGCRNVGIVLSRRKGVVITCIIFFRADFILTPTFEGVANTGRLSIRNREDVGQGRFSRRLGITLGFGRAGAAIGIIVQRVCIFRGGIGVLRYEIDRSALIAGGRTALVKRPRCGIRVGFFRPTDDLVTALNSSATCGCLDIRNRDRVVVIRGIGVIRLVLANKLGLFGRTVVVANVEFVTHIQDGKGDIDLMPGVQSGGSYTGVGNRRHGHSSCTGLARLPLGNIGDIRSHGSRNGGIPAGEGIAFPSRGAAESGGRGTGRQVAVNLIGKYCAVCTVSVCNGECFRLFRCRGILVLRLLLRGGVGLLLVPVHCDGLGLGFVSPRRILCQRSRGQKCEDHEQCQKQTENSAQTMVFHLEILSFHLEIHAGGTDRLHGNAIITFMPELYAISHQKSMGKDVDFLQLGKKTGPSP